jgi:glycosyltransferase involved in cell wall biosynthesis
VLSFVIPAHDEEVLIGRAIAALRSAADTAGVPYEVIVVNDSSTDRTAAIAEAAGARVVSVNVRQIGAARNAGAAVATGDTLVFVDADTFITPANLQGALQAMRDGAIGGGAAAQFDEPVTRSARVILKIWVWLSRTLRLAAGSFFFCSKAAFETAGGFDPAYYAGEEVYLSRRLNKRGKFVILKEPVLTSGRKARTHTGWEIARTWLGLTIRPWSMRDRSRLDWWYGPRRKDQERL